MMNKRTEASLKEYGDVKLRQTCERYKETGIGAKITEIIDNERNTPWHGSQWIKEQKMERGALAMVIDTYKDSPALDDVVDCMLQVSRRKDVNVHMPFNFGPLSYVAETLLAYAQAPEIYVGATLRMKDERGNYDSRREEPTLRPAVSWVARVIRERYEGIRVDKPDTAYLLADAAQAKLGVERAQELLSRIKTDVWCDMRNSQAAHEVVRFLGRPSSVETICEYGQNPNFDHMLQRVEQCWGTPDVEDTIRELDILGRPYVREALQQLATQGVEMSAGYHAWPGLNHSEQSFWHGSTEEVRTQLGEYLRCAQHVNKGPAERRESRLELLSRWLSAGEPAPEWGRKHNRE